MFECCYSEVVFKFRNLHFLVDEKGNFFLDFCIIGFGVLFVALEGILLHLEVREFIGKRKEKEYSLGMFSESSYLTSQS